jgi:hypothetical protein
VNKQTIKAKILPFGYMTFRFTNGGTPPQVEGLTAIALSEKK